MNCPHWILEICVIDELCHSLCLHWITSEFNSNDKWSATFPTQWVFLELLRPSKRWIDYEWIKQNFDNNCTDPRLFFFSYHAQVIPCLCVSSIQLETRRTTWITGCCYWFVRVLAVHLPPIFWCWQWAAQNHTKSHFKS